MSKDLIPWSWDVQNMCGHVMELIEKNCTNCVMYQTKPAMCGYICGYFGGKYPQAAPPKDWYVTPEGVPVCTGFQEFTTYEAPAIGKVPTETPAPAPTEVPRVRYILVLDSEKDRIFRIEHNEIKNFKEKNYTVKPLENKVLEHLLNTIYKKD